MAELSLPLCGTVSVLGFATNRQARQCILAESSSTLLCLSTGLSLPVALHPASQRRSYLQLRTGECSRPEGTFTFLLVRTFRRTYFGHFGPRRGRPRSIRTDAKRMQPRGAPSFHGPGTCFSNDSAETKIPSYSLSNKPQAFHEHDRKDHRSPLYRGLRYHQRRNRHRRAARVQGMDQTLH